MRPNIVRILFYNQKLNYQEYTVEIRDQKRVEKEGEYPVDVMCPHIVTKEQARKAGEWLMENFRY